MVRGKGDGWASCVCCTSLARACHSTTACPLLMVCICLQGDLFGSTFSLKTGGVDDLPKDILIPGVTLATRNIITRGHNSAPPNKGS